MTDERVNLNKTEMALCTCSVRKQMVLYTCSDLHENLTKFIILSNGGKGSTDGAYITLV